MSEKEKNYGSMNMGQLKAELKKRGAKLSGRKQQLVERLLAYDRNQDFGHRAEEEHCFVMDLPSPQTYKDILSQNEVPAFTREDLTAFLQPLGDGSIKSAQELYNSMCLRTARFATHNSDAFFTGQCWAEMKKSVQYKVDLKFESHSSVATLSETQCECAAGQGPTAHCKHVKTLLLGLIDLRKTGSLKVETTCTEVPQSFHRPKKLYRGQPVKAEELCLRNNRVTGSCDPRPMVLRGFTAEKLYRIRNLVLNFVGNAKVKLPICDSYLPANTIAVDRDHDYLSKPTSDVFLDKEQVTSVTAEQAKEIEARTRIQGGEGWLQERTKRLPSSRFGEICRATERKNMAALASNLLFVQPRINSAPLRHGHTYEKVAIKKLEISLGHKVRNCGIFVNPEFPFLGSSPDGLIGDHLTVEVKCPYAAKDKDITPVTVPYLTKTADGLLSLDKSHVYYYQVQGQLMITGRSLCKFAVYTLKDFLVIDIPFDPEFVTEMQTKLKNFFEDFFKPAYLKLHFYGDYYKLNCSCEKP